MGRQPEGSQWGNAAQLRLSAARALLVAALGAAVVATVSLGGGGAAKGAPLAFSYTSIAPVPIGTNEAQSVVVGDKMYLFGGFDGLKQTFTPTDRAYVYDPATNHWTALPAMPLHGITHAGIATDGAHSIYYAGGSASSANATSQVFGSTDAFRYDIDAGTYSRLPSLPAPRMGGGLAYVAGKLYYFGGNNITRTLDTADTWMLDLARGATSWVSEAPMPDARNHLGWAVLDGMIYVVGGQHLDRSSTAQGALDRYDPASNTWTVLPSMPLPRGHVMDSTFTLDGDLVVAGGWTTTDVSAAVLAYDPKSATWSSWPNLPEPRTSTTVKGISGGRFVYCCGSDGTSSARAWLAVPATPPTVTPTVPPVVTPTVSPTGTAAPQPQPTVAPTTPPPAAAPPTTAPRPPAQIPPPAVAKLTIGGVAVHASTVRSRSAGGAQVSYTLSRPAKVTLVVERCANGSCHRIAGRTVAAPGRASHVSLHALTGHERLPVAHYRIVVSAPGTAAVTLHFVVVGD